MSIENQRVSLCRFLLSLAEEKQLSMEELAAKVNMQPEHVSSILQGDGSPSVDELIAIANELDTQLTFQHTISFAHKKVATKVK